MTSVETRIVLATPPVQAEWDALATRVDASPFVLPAWVLAWQDAFGTTPLRIVTARRQDGRLVGVLPLITRRGGFSSPTNWHTPEFSVVAESPEVYDTLVETAVDASPWRLELSFLGQDTVARVASVAERMGRHAFSRTLEKSPHIPLLASTFEDYAARLPRHTRAEIRRRRGKLTNIGPVRLEVYETADEHALSRFLEVENSGWKAEQGTSIVQDPGAAAFYPAVARWAARKGWLRLALLTVGGRAIAGDFAIQAQGVHYLLKTGYDDEFRAFGPGKILRLDMIRRAFEDGLTSYDFLGDEDPWKQEWTDQVQRRMRVQVFGRGAAGRLAEAGQRYARPAAKQVTAKVQQWRNHR